MNQMRDVPIASIQPNPDQPRKSFDPDALADLAASIQRNGLLQPIAVRPLNGSYQIIAGERRWRACQIANLDVVPCIIFDVSDRETFLLATMENMARVAMTPIEEARAMQQLLDVGLEPTDIESRLGIARGMVKARTSLLATIESVQFLVGRGQFPVRLAAYMSKLSANAQQKSMRAYQSKKMYETEFFAIVDALYADENNVDMFPETKVSEEARAEADAFRTALGKITSGAAQLSDLDLTLAAAVLAPEIERIKAQIAGAYKMLYAAQSNVEKAAGTAAVQKGMCG